MADKTSGANSRAREQDRLMPIANVMRLMRKVLPGHAKIADDSKETIQECVSEFISFITSEANDRCQREQRRTITTEDIMWAMWKLGFDDYIEPLSLFLQKYREAEGDHRCRELLPSIKKEAKRVICKPSSSNAGGANDGNMVFDPHANSYTGVPIPFDPFSQYQL